MTETKPETLPTTTEIRLAHFADPERFKRYALAEHRWLADNPDHPGEYMEMVKQRGFVYETRLDVFPLFYPEDDDARSLWEADPNRSFQFFAVRNHYDERILAVQCYYGEDYLGEIQLRTDGDWTVPWWMSKSEPVRGSIIDVARWLLNNSPHARRRYGS